MRELDTRVVLEDLVVQDQLLDLVAEVGVHVHVFILLVLLFRMAVHFHQIHYTLF